MNVRNRDNRGGRLLWSLLVLVFLPNFVYVFFEVSSLAIGLVLAAALLLIINYRELKVFHKNTFFILLIVSVVIVLHACYLFYVSGEVKALSTIGLVAVYLTAPLLSRNLVEISDVELEKVLRILIHVLSIVGWGGLVYVFVFADGHKIKYPFPFPEPSFFALCYGLFAVSYSCVSTWRFSVYMISSMISFAMLFPSLAFLVFASIVCLITLLRLRVLYSIIGFVALLITFSAFSFFILDIEYFSDRLRFSDTDNITTLVWLQGWDLSYANLISTEWRGLGIQMLGQNNVQLGEISYKLERLTGKLMNISSGGFLASKIISELGLLGGVISFAYLLFLVCFCFKMFRDNVHHRLGASAEKVKLILQGLVFGYVVEYFFRGYGYFSPSLYIVVASIFAIYYMHSKAKLINRCS